MESKITRILRTAAVVLAAASASACNGEEPGSESVALRLMQTTLSFGNAASSQNIAYKASGRPYIDGDCSWASCEVSSMESGGGVITVSVMKNEEFVQRTATFTVKLVLTGESAVFTVSQQPGDMEDAGLATQEPGIVSNDATAFLAGFGMGYNLGNHFDSHDRGGICDYNGDGVEEWWDGGTPSAATYKTLYSRGFHSIRIPVTWSKHMGPAPDYAIDPAFLDLVAQNVLWARDAGFRVIVNMHHDDASSWDKDGNKVFQNWLDVESAAADGAKKAEISDRYAKVWRQIAERFRDEGDYLMLECFNEVNDGGWGWSRSFRSDPTAQTSILNEWLQLFVDTVRSTGGGNATRWLGVSGYCANPAFVMDYIELPYDSVPGRLAVAIHDYDPSSYTIGDGDYPQWGHTAKTGPSEDEQTYIATVKALYDKFIVNNIPVYAGEAGCKNKSGEIPIAFKKYYLEYTWRAFTAYGMPLFLWDGGTESVQGDAHGFMSHNTGDYINSVTRDYVEAIYRAVYTPKSDDYSLKTIYNNAPRLD